MSWSLLIVSLSFLGVTMVFGLIPSIYEFGTPGMVPQHDRSQTPGSPFPGNSLPGSSLPGSAQVVEIEVVDDMSLGYVQRLSKIEWGVLNVGDAVDRVINIRNVGTIPVTLSFNTTNWDPVAAVDCIHLSWDYDGSVMGPETMLMVTLTLTVDSTTINFSDFSFDILITGMSA